MSDDRSLARRGLAIAEDVARLNTLQDGETINDEIMSAPDSRIQTNDRHPEEDYQNRSGIENGMTNQKTRSSSAPQTMTAIDEEYRLITRNEFDAWMRKQNKIRATRRKRQQRSKEKFRQSIQRQSESGSQDYSPYTLTSDSNEGKWKSRRSMGIRTLNTAAGLAATLLPPAVSTLLPADGNVNKTVSIPSRESAATSAATGSKVVKEQSEAGSLTQGLEKTQAEKTEVPKELEKKPEDGQVTAAPDTNGSRPSSSSTEIITKKSSTPKKRTSGLSKDNLTEVERILLVKGDSITADKNTGKVLKGRDEHDVDDDRDSDYDWAAFQSGDMRPMLQQVLDTLRYDIFSYIERKQLHNIVPGSILKETADVRLIRWLDPVWKVVPVDVVTYVDDSGTPTLGESTVSTESATTPGGKKKNVTTALVPRSLFEVPLEKSRRQTFFERMGASRILSRGKSDSVAIVDGTQMYRSMAKTDGATCEVGASSKDNPSFRKSLTDVESKAFGLEDAEKETLFSHRLVFLLKCCMFRDEESFDAKTRAKIRFRQKGLGNPVFHVQLHILGTDDADIEDCIEKGMIERMAIEKITSARDKDPMVWDFLRFPGTI